MNKLMILNELYNKDYKDVPMIGIYETDDQERPLGIAYDYADEILETHGNMTVVDYIYSKEDNCLIVEFKK